MNDILFYTLYTLIPTSFVSVENSKTMSVYSFTIPDENGEETYINLCSYYSHTDPKNSYVAYELYIDDEMIARAIKPIFDRKPANPLQKKNINTDNGRKTGNIIIPVFQENNSAGI